MNYHKRIILDFDDTLAFTTNRDWDNAVPNVKLIEKTNKLYDDGWTIDIFTARGSISCDTRADAARKYKPGIESWLEKNSVKYHSISFDKPLAAYYIDDKGMTPEDFLDVNIVQLEGGLSGSDIYTDGNLVHKKDPNSHAVAKWFNTVQNVNVPPVDRIVGDIITMKYIDHDKDFFKNKPYVALGLIQETLESIISTPAPQDGLEFDSYVERVYKHAEASELHLFLKIASKLKKFIFARTFSHGDFGITNMLFTKNHELFMIDPIPNVFGCRQLDAAKFIASLHINQYDTKLIEIASKSMSTYNNIPSEWLATLVSAELIRVYKYHPNKEFIEECVKNVFE